MGRLIAMRPLMMSTWAARQPIGLAAAWSPSSMTPICCQLTYLQSATSCEVRLFGTVLLPSSLNSHPMACSLLQREQYQPQRITQKPWRLVLLPSGKSQWSARSENSSQMTHGNGYEETEYRKIGGQRNQNGYSKSNTRRMAPSNASNRVSPRAATRSAKESTTSSPFRRLCARRIFAFCWRFVCSLD